MAKYTPELITKNLTVNKNDAIMQMYASIRVLSDVYNKLGDTRVDAATAMLAKNSTNNWK